MKFVLKYLFQTSADLEIEAADVEEAMSMALKTRIITFALSETPLGWDDVIDGQVTIDYDDGTPATADYFDIGI